MKTRCMASPRNHAACLRFRWSTTVGQPQGVADCSDTVRSVTIATASAVTIPGFHRLWLVVVHATTIIIIHTGTVRGIGTAESAEVLQNLDFFTAIHCGHVCLAGIRAIWSLTVDPTDLVRASRNVNRAGIRRAITVHPAFDTTNLRSFIAGFAVVLTFVDLIAISRRLDLEISSRLAVCRLQNPMWSQA